MSPAKGPVRSTLKTQKAFLRLLVVLSSILSWTLVTQHINWAANRIRQPFHRDGIDDVLKAISNAVANDYYDKRTACEVWPKVAANYEQRVRAAATKQKALRLIREMLSKLHNSHVSFSREEWAMRQNVLPFFFERVGNRIFVRKPLDDSSLHFGDEVISIDGRPASKLQPRSLTRLDEVSENPLYDPAGSTAELKIFRDGKEFNLREARGRLDEGRLELHELKPGIAYVVFTELANEGAAGEELQRAWKKVTSSQAVVLDLRNCSGGWPGTSEYLLDSFLGPGHKHFAMEDRQGQTLPSPPAFALAPRFTGTVVVLQGGQTQSECEKLTAALRETKRATLVGDKTAGAFNGFTKAIDLPGGFALFALPYTRSISPSGIEYEGVGVQADFVVKNSIADFRMHRDAVLHAAENILSSQ